MIFYVREITKLTKVTKLFTMSVLSTLRNSLTQLTRTRVTWHPKGITAVRRFTIEPCAAIPKRRLKRKPSSIIKNANPEEATPFTVISEPGEEPCTLIQGKLPKEPMSRINNVAYSKMQAWLHQLDEEPPPEHGNLTLIKGELPKEPMCHTHNMSYIRMQAWIQLLERGVDINYFYMNSELPLSFMKEDTEELYD